MSLSFSLFFLFVIVAFICSWLNNLQSVDNVNTEVKRQLSEKGAISPVKRACFCPI